MRCLLLPAIACLLLTVVTAATAHPVLVPRPTQTLADWVLASSSLALAREDPARPYYYAITETIKGGPVKEQPELFMPSQVRRRLAANEDLTVLLAEDSRSGEWRALGVGTDDYLRVVRRILTFSDTWTPNETNNLARIHEFTPLLGHEDIRLHELAYLEIGRASYASIRSVSADVSLERVREMLEVPKYMEWRGLDIMLLGLSGNQSDRARVVETMHVMQQHSLDLDLAAWATAYMEVTGPDGIDELAQWYFTDKDRTRKELRAVARAMAGHANETPGLQPPVMEAYGALLDTHPEVAPDIAHDLIAWKRWDFAERMQELKPELARKDPLGVYKVNLYLQRAKRYHHDKQS